ncbi:Sterol 3-beta-glucosyltransferase [Sporothrix stenoceras]|uniref:sterol 3beta-glucosyltransferase n=1 Tax=Sporothrix stenoceras TaxID=5173 RepID=A0ABR3YKH5_9PEZI
MVPPIDKAAPTAATSHSQTPTPTQTPPPLSTTPSNVSNRNTNTSNTTTSSSTATLSAPNTATAAASLPAPVSTAASASPSPGPSRTVSGTASPTTPSTSTKKHHHHKHSHSHGLRLPSRLSSQSTSALASALAASPNPLSGSSPRHSEDETGRSSSRHKFKRLVKRRHESASGATGGSQRTPKTMEFPERLQQEDDDAGDEEVIRPIVSGNGVFYNMNQSVFSMLAAAGSNIDFNNRFGTHSSDEDDGGDGEGGDDGDDNDGHGRRLGGGDGAATTVLPATGSSSKKSGKKPASDLSQSTIFTRHQSSGSTSSTGGKDGDRRSRFSDSKLMRSLPSLKSKLSSSKRRSSSGLSSKSSKNAGASGTGSSRILEEDEDADAEAESSGGTPSSTQTRLPRGSGATSEADVVVSSERGSNSPSIRVTRADRSDSVRSIPVMSRMLEAKEQAALRPSFDIDRDRKSSDKDKDKRGGGSDLVDVEDGGPSMLARRLMEIFEFDKPEEVIEEYPCWLLQSVMLQGYMYITSRHICFYAYLPKKANEVAKSGHLAKSGKRNPRYNRFWFRLKGDVFSYYRDSKALYFPHGQIDLRYGISATLTDKDKDGTHFQVVTHHRTYYFRADSAASAKEWVKSLQRVIFRSHNDGDSIKISLPIENVIDVEENQAMVEFTETCKIRVIDNDETFAIDEYFFSFFDYGKDAVRVLKILIDANNNGGDGDDQNNSGTGTPHRQHGRRLDLPSAGQGTDDRFSQDSTGSAAFGAGQERISMSGSGSKPPTKLHDSVRATLFPTPPTAASSPRASGEIPRASFDALRSSFGPSRRSLDMNQALGGSGSGSPRRSFSDRIKGSSSQQRKVSSRSQSGTQHQYQQSSDLQDSADSFMQSSVEDPSQISFSNMAASSSDDPSASQILHGSEVFQNPTVDAGSPSSSSKPRHNIPKPHLPHHAATTGHIRRVNDQNAYDAGETEEGLAQNLARLGTYPLQRAGAYAGWLNRQSRRVSTMLATESMGYVEKVSGMWRGGRQHYDDAALIPHAEDGNPDGEPGMSVADAIVSNEHFREHFALPDTEKLQATYFGSIMRVLPLYGKIYISQRYFCFRSLVPGTRTKLILPLKDIENVTKEKGFRFTYSGLVVVIRGHEELFFEFHQADMRDDCAITLLHLLEKARSMKESGILNEEDKADAELALAERDALKEAREEAAARMDEHAETPAESAANAVSAAKAVVSAEAKEERQNRKILRQSALMAEAPTILFDDPKASFLNFKPAKPLRITCLTIGSRGDVQPYISLGRGLLAEGHHVRIATHPEFEGWIRSHGLDYGRVEGDPGELMRICIENGTFTFQFLREANSKMRTWLDELLASAWTACQGADLLIESPSAMAGIHIAEKLQIPYFRAFTMPWTRTRAYPHAFLMPERKMGGAYNQFSYTMFETIFWKATAGQINRWRNKMLGLRNTSLEKLQVNKVPFLYNFSACVVPPPLDYSDWIRVTGYWFLDEGTGIKKGNDPKEKDGGSESQDKTAVEKKDPAWSPPQDLLDFIAKAREDRKKIVYVGFGSIVVTDPAKMTQEVIDAVHKADVRCILSKGWSDRLVAKKDTTVDATVAAPPPEDELPAEIFPIKSAPHDWLFAQIDAAAHHGGSGTTGASLRAGIPTIIRPFFGDQFFFGQRVEDLGVGICLKKWGAMSFARALWEATNSERMIRKAAHLGEQIREENGVDTAIQCIYRDMEYAKSLVREKAVKSGMLRSSVASAGDESDADGYDDDDEPEESWTFVGDDDPMQQSMILTPEAGGSGSVSPAAGQSGAGAGAGGGGYKALGSRILGIATQKQ